MQLPEQVPYHHCKNTKPHWVYSLWSGQLLLLGSLVAGSPLAASLVLLYIRLAPPFCPNSYYIRITSYGSADESAIAKHWSSSLKEQLKCNTECFCWTASKELTLGAETSVPSVARWISRLSRAKRQERRGGTLITLQHLDLRQTGLNRDVCQTHTHTRVYEAEGKQSLCEPYWFSISLQLSKVIVAVLSVPFLS